MSLKFGAHLSIAGGYSEAVKRALDGGCETFQIFSSNPRNLIAKKDFDLAEADKFIEMVDSNSLGPVVVHANYLINLSSPDENKYELAKKSLKGELTRADGLRASFLVLHPGHAMGLERDEALKRVALALDDVCEAVEPKVLICLENMSGVGTEIGGKFSELHEIIKYSKCEKHLGVCLDTCHSFVSGYDVSSKEGLDSLFSEIEDTIGSERIKVVHINDSLGALGSRRDRHANIGKGQIGLDGFKYIVNRKELNNCPFVLETPEEDDNAHVEDLRILRSLVEE